MPETPAIKFISLFVNDLEQTSRRYAAILGIEPSRNDPDVLSPHPFAKAGPVVFNLGQIKLALYQCDNRGTHVGDVGIGLAPHESPSHLAMRATTQGGQVFFGPQTLPGDGRELAVFVLPDRHFFEVIGPRKAENPL